ncbi:twin-arginine translocation signal domain-containing protein [Nocardioides sp. SOB77]|uniref:Twin-arginine translocation signal domain-containing protein n=1 Tax=Nocardioides oceani TaxID=3058369 RepID=A0ABT8FHD8_9ACTN|nr:twin-arginine translocation signal domain-containing protein [Nocardioides oceani]MDN4173966.1 twin-arginine translocation signal domain-containing protein [Nocardioides oceani]
MSDTNRRKFLAATGAGAAVGAVALTTGSASAAEARLRSTSAKDRVVAVVEDHRSSELTLLVGEREVVVRDRDLVTRILNAAGGE